LNTTGHCAVVGNPITGKVLKRSEIAYYVHKNTRVLGGICKKRVSTERLNKSGIVSRG